MGSKRQSGKNKNGRNGKHNNYKKTWKDVVDSAIGRITAKGQLPITLIILCFLVVIIKIPGTELAQLLDKYMAGVTQVQILTIIITFLANIFVVIVMTTRARRISEAENERIAKERDFWKEQCLSKGLLKSSEGTR